MSIARLIEQKSGDARRSAAQVTKDLEIFRTTGIPVQVLREQTLIKAGLIRRNKLGVINPTKLLNKRLGMRNE